MDQAAECISSSPGGSAYRPLARRALLPRTRGRGRATRCAAPTPSRARRLEVGSGRWLLNPGSVGQPRDGDPRAAWLELDTDAWTATYHRVEYDIDGAAEAIESAGLPAQLADRLYAGQ